MPHSLALLPPNPSRSTGNYLLQLEAVQLLLVMCSTQLFTPQARGQLGEHPFLEAIMQVGVESLCTVFCGLGSGEFEGQGGACCHALSRGCWTCALGEPLGACCVLAAT